MKEVSFDGKFTSEMKRRLQERLDELRVPKHVVARFLGISNSTLSKWQNGRTPVCSPKHRALLQDFFNGEFDRQIRQSSFSFAGEKFQLSTALLPDAERHYREMRGKSRALEYVVEVGNAIEESLRLLVAELLTQPNSLAVIQNILRYARH